MKKRQKLRQGYYNRRRMLQSLMFTGPWIIGASIFFIYPLFYSLRLSFSTIINQATQALEFAGLDHYKTVFLEDARFFPVLLSNAKDTLFNTPLIVVFSLFIATLLNRNMAGKGFFRTVFFLPVILGAGFVMEQLLGVQISEGATEVARGILLPDKVVHFLPPGITSIILDFLSRITLILWHSGVQIVVFLAGLQSVPRSFYEAAKVDAASGWECFWFISLPMMVPTILLISVFTIVVGFLDTSNEMLSYIHELEFQWTQAEYAAAVSWLYFLFVIAVLALLFAVLLPASKRVRE